MGLVILGLIVLLIYLAIRLTAAAGAWLSGKRFRAYRALATRYQGRYENRGLSDPPTVSFSYNGSSVRVGLAPQVPGQAHGPRTRVVARFRTGLPFRMELAPIARPAPRQPPKGTRLVRVGDPEFDRGFVVQANDAEMARAFLAPEVRAAVVNLLRLAPPAGMLLSINPERLLVQVDRNVAVLPDALLMAVREAMVMHDGLQAGVACRLKQGIDDRGHRPRAARGRRPADLQGLRRSDPHPRRELRRLRDAPSPRLLGVRRLLLDLRLYRQAKRLDPGTDIVVNIDPRLSRPVRRFRFPQ